jgi:uncharacterized protein (DUF427 family)
MEKAPVCPGLSRFLDRMLALDGHQSGHSDARARAVPGAAPQEDERRARRQYHRPKRRRGDPLRAARYPVAYFPIGDIDKSVLQPANHVSTHQDLGKTKWFNVVGGDSETTRRGAWEHVDPPAQAAALRDTVAFAWRTMDAFYEEDERILGHAADPYHRIDIRRTSRQLVVRQDDRAVADTHAPLVLYESGFAPRWYVPRGDIAAEALHAVEGQTLCPYKGFASYYDVGDARNAAWSYRAPFEEVAGIADLVSFYPEKVTITIDGEKLEAASGQNVISHGADRNLSVDEVGGIQLEEETAAAEA